MIRIAFVCLLITLCALDTNVFAQPSLNPTAKSTNTKSAPVKKTSKSNAPKRAQNLFAKSNESYNYERFDEAIALLQKAIKRYPKYEQAYKRIATIAWEQKNYDLAQTTYKQVERLFPSANNRMYANYYLAKMAYEQQHYKDVINYANKSMALKDSTKNVKDLATKVQQLLDNANFAQTAINFPVPFKPIHMDSSVNSVYDEYLPTLTADEQSLVFTRRLSGDVNLNEDFYFATRNSADSTWKQAIPMRNINTLGDEGAICISPDGKRLFFAARDRADGLGNFDIYYCVKSGETWDGPYNLGMPINSRGWESQPSISADGKELYFCSKRKDGFGGVDIWMSQLKNNFWTPPVNLGKNINTPLDEQSPVIHPDGQTLYFSSNGQIGMGDADLYLSRRQPDGLWGKAENLGYPINTPANENGLVVTANGQRAYYSSYVDTAGLDLFYFDLPPRAKPQQVTYVKGVVSDARNPKKKLSATIELTDLATGEMILKTVSDTNSGEFLTTLPIGKNYMYNVSRDGYLFYSENFSLKDFSLATDQQKPFLLNIALQPLQHDTTKAWNVGERVVLKNVFFETDSYQLRPESYPELNKLTDLLNANPQLKIEIGGHTDSIGTASYNQKLSTERAKAVYDYLVQKSTSPDRLAYKGYGSSQPVAPNNTPEGRAINRRTEFVILAGRKDK